MLSGGLGFLANRRGWQKCRRQTHGSSKASPFHLRSYAWDRFPTFTDRAVFNPLGKRTEEAEKLFDSLHAR